MSSIEEQREIAKICYFNAARFYQQSARLSMDDRDAGLLDYSIEWQEDAAKDSFSMCYYRDRWIRLMQK